MVVISHRLRAAVIAGVTLGCLYSAATHAQKSPLGDQDNGGLNGSLSRSDLEKLGGGHGASGTSLTPAKAKEQSAKLLAALQLSCEISAAQLVVSGSRRIDGKETPVRVFDVACAQGLGYLLETQGAATPVAISCLTAEEARAADVAKGKEPGFFCKLPENHDVYAAVASLIASGTGGAQCMVQRLQWLGRSDSAHSEYSEVACEGGKGYVLGTALPGSQAKVTVTSCGDAARQGVRCRLTDSGPAENEPTLDTLKEVLAPHVSCKIDPIRLVGQEEHLKRYVVEYHCADQPAAGIAFVPLPGNTNPYESIDCAAGAIRGIACLKAPAGP
jgi:hypothetical protein